MKIALIHNSILPPKNYGGIERIVLALAEEYQRLGHEVLIAARKGSQIKDFAFCELPTQHQDRAAESYLPADVNFVHSHEPLRIKPKIPFLVSIHGNGHPEETYWHNTNFLSQSHARNHNAKFYVYNGLSLSRYPYKEEKEDYFVFLARTTWRIKNVRTAVAWAKELGVRLEIMGGQGYSHNGIRYRGLVDEQEKLDVLSNARALIYPTNWDEPCAAAPLEALACGTPVISSSNGCMPELIRPGSGVVCETYADLLASVDRLGEIRSQDCRRSVQNLFTVERMAQDYLDLMTRILQEGELPHSPKYQFAKQSVRLLYKPTLRNRLSLAFLGKV